LAYPLRSHHPLNLPSRGWFSAAFEVAEEKVGLQFHFCVARPEQFRTGTSRCSRSSSNDRRIGI
jgi:hypothetical protein